MTIDINRQIKAFGIGPAEAGLLRTVSGILAPQMEEILVQSRDRFAAWPEVAAALAHPDVHRARHAHWLKAIAGVYDAEFLRSATAFSEMFLNRGIPSYSIVLCHNAVLGVAAPRLAAALKGGRKLFGGTNGQLEAALDATTRAVWLDVEVLMEAYSMVDSEARKAVLGKLANDFSARVLSLVENVATSARSMEESARGMSENVSATARVSTAVAAAAQEASTNVEAVAHSAEELGKSVREISEQVNSSASIAAEAVGQAQQTSETIASMAQSAERIGQIVGMISDIAAQTNLLALNATIESARAGEAGRGFAVVAAEVKGLAGQTANATEEISRQIQDMQQITSNVVQSIERIRGVIDRINQSSITISSAVEEQSVATREIAQNTQQTAEGAGEVSRKIVEVQDGATHTGEAAGKVLTAASALGTNASDLRKEVARFLDEIRSAA